MELRLLGELEFRAAGQLLDVGAPRQQAVLVALAVDVGRPVAIETLIDRVWADSPPVEARNVLYSYLSRIRRLLRQASTYGEAAVRIERRHAGYVLDLDPDLVDLHRFRRLIEQGRDPQCADTARVGFLAEALGLWRGPPLAGIPGEWGAQVRDSWHRQRLDAVVLWAHAELRLGHPSAIVTTLPDLVAEYPLVEPLEGLLMRALHATGRDAEAVDRYTAVRQRLADDLGTDPSVELRHLHQAILRGESTAFPSPAYEVSLATNVATPAQPPLLGRRLDRDQGVADYHERPHIGRFVEVETASAKSAVHCTIVVVDVEGFGGPSRTLQHQIGIRAALYRVVAEAFRTAGVPWERCRHEDRGDAVFVLVPADVPKGPLVEIAPDAMVRALHAHNNTSDGPQRLRLRMAVHAGEVARDEHGSTSTAINTAFRLLDAKPFKQALRDSPGVLALIVSRWVFDEVVRHSAVLDSATFRPISVVVKETRDTAWIALPDHPYITDPTVLERPADYTTTSSHPTPAPVIPRQLPPAPAPFVGRADPLAHLDRAMKAVTAPIDTATDPASGKGSAVLISALGGAGGIGKTWLALHWAHRNVHQFPDGQLFVDLRGFSPDSNPLDPSTAVRNFLDGLGVDPGGIPADLDAQAALYRSKAAGKRMLIMLDNAATTNQVAPLLPGTATCTVLVTSRRKLATLITRYGARHLQLDILARDEAHILLNERLGQARVTAQPDAADELIRLCGRYPLALAIMAHHAHIRPHIPLIEFATELRDLGLDTLDHDDDPAASLPTVLSWSLRSLTTEQRTVFALLGIAPGPDIGLPAAASLTGLSQRHVSKVLDALEEASLLGRQPGGRYTMHDLIRDYAAATALHDLADDVREAALRRVLDYYTHTAHTADHLLDPHRQPVQLTPLAPGTYPHPLPDSSAAVIWFDTEHADLLAAQHTATTHAWHHTVWLLAWTLTTFHIRRGHRHDQLAMWRTALDAAAHLPDPATRIRTHQRLGYAYSDLRRYQEAMEHLHQALILAEHHHDPTEQAHTLRAISWTWAHRGDDQQALKHSTRALALFRAQNQPVWEAITLNDVGWDAAQLGDYDTARTHCQAALTLNQRHHNRTGEANTLHSLGHIAHHTGDPHSAIRYYLQALPLFRDIGHTHHVAETLDGLGHAHAALGHLDHARTVWQEALQMYREQRHDHDVERVQRQLDALDHPGGHQPAEPTESAN